MLTVSIRKLTEAVVEAAAFTLPGMNAGTQHLFDNLYRRLSRGGDVRLSELDFDAFESDDITSLNDLYSDVFETNSYTAHGIVSALRRIDPVYSPVSFV